MGITNQIQSIPKILKGILMGFLTVTMIRITYPIANYIMGLFTTGTPFYYVSILVYWLIIIYVTWFELWIRIFQPKTGEN